MKRSFLLFFVCFFAACNNQENENAASDSSDNKTDTAVTGKKIDPIFEEHVHEKDTVDLYSNKRFRNVRVEKLNDTSYRITGKAQVFEATLSWVVEDGHNELLNGYTNTDAGAPEFGNFNFILNVKKKRPESTLMLILFEASPKDGSRTHELPVVLN